MTKTKWQNFAVEPEMKERVRLQARKEERTCGAICRIALQRYFESMPK